MRRAGSHQHFQVFGYVAGTEAFHVVGIDGIGQTELLTHRHLRRSIGSQRLRHYVAK